MVPLDGSQVALNNFWNPWSIKKGFGVLLFCDALKTHRKEIDLFDIKKLFVEVKSNIQKKYFRDFIKVTKIVKNVDSFY